MSQGNIRITLLSQHQSLQINKLPQSRLLVPLGIIAPSSTNQQHILNTRLLGRIGQLDANVKLVLLRGRDQADGVAADLLEGIDHLALAAGVVGHDEGTERLELFGLGRGRVEGEAAEAGDLLLEALFFEEELGDEEAGLAVDGGDANVAGVGHFGGGGKSTLG